MRIFRDICLAVAFMAVPRLTPAAPTVPPATLGHLEATVNFCASADSKWGSKYKEIGKNLVRGMSEKELADARNSSEYKDSYAGVKTEIEKIPADKRIETCRDALK